jgi:hypothetical protein
MNEVYGKSNVVYGCLYGNSFVYGPFAYGSAYGKHYGNRAQAKRPLRGKSAESKRANEGVLGKRARTKPVHSKARPADSSTRKAIRSLRAFAASHNELETFDATLAAIFEPYG